MRLTSGLLFTMAMTALGLLGCAQDVLAHTGERAFVLLLPTKIYITAGALVVAATFLIASGLRPGSAARLEGAVWRLPIRVRTCPVWVSGATLSLIVVLIVAGITGSRDPLTNPLPVMVWSVWWVGLTLLHATFGNLWSWLDPWSPIARIVSPAGRAPRVTYPRWLAYWPALLILFGFSWFELVYPAPQDPARLAFAAIIYVVGTTVGIALYGKSTWLQFADAFSVFFRLVSWLAPLGPSRHRADQGDCLDLCWPGARLLRMSTLPVSLIAFVLLALASVSFDGLSRTFWWLALIGVNPLVHPGRTALMGVNTLGLIATFAAFLAVYGIVARVARSLSGASQTKGAFALSIVPIAFGYHFAHYLPTFLIDVQLAARALSDPFSAGWDLFGSAQLPITASLLTHHRSVEVIWNLQATGIVLAHVCAVVIGHLFVLRHADGRSGAAITQLPATALMIVYTVFGLWLLSTPAVG